MIGVTARLDPVYRRSLSETNHSRMLPNELPRLFVTKILCTYVTLQMYYECRQLITVTVTVSSLMLYTHSFRQDVPITLVTGDSFESARLWHCLNFQLLCGAPQVAHLAPFLCITFYNDLLTVSKVDC